MKDISKEFKLAVQNFRNKLAEAGHSDHILWRFREHLSIRWRRAFDGGFFLSYPLHFIELDHSDAECVYTGLISLGSPIVFDLLAITKEYSVCTLAFDPWESEDDDYSVFDGVYYTVNNPYPECEAVTSKSKWLLHRITAKRCLSGLDYVPRLARFQRS